MLTGFIEAVSAFWFKPGRLTGRIATKGGHWYMVFNFVNEDGKARPKWVSTKLPERNNKTEAKRLLTDELARYNEMTASASNITMTELITLWLEKCKRGVRSNSHTAYQSVAKLHVIPYFSALGFQVNEITSQMVKSITIKSILKVYPAVPSPNTEPSYILRYSSR